MLNFMYNAFIRQIKLHAHFRKNSQKVKKLHLVKELEETVIFVKRLEDTSGPFHIKMHGRLCGRDRTLAASQSSPDQKTFTKRDLLKDTWIQETTKTDQTVFERLAREISAKNSYSQKRKIGQQTVKG